MIHPIEKAREAIKFYQECISNAPDELMTAVAVMTSPEGQPVVALFACYNGPIEAGEQVLRPLREFGPPVADEIQPMPYTVLQGMLGELLPPGRRNYIKTNFMSEISRDATETLLERFATVPSPYSVLVCFQFGGAIGRVGKDETAFYNRDAGYHFMVASVWEDPADDLKNFRWARETWGCDATLQVRGCLRQ